MIRNTLIATLFATSALTLAGPASAESKSDRAREAIAAAEAKIRTAQDMGAATVDPRDTANAQAALASAHAEFKDWDKDPAIHDAIRASALADTAIGFTQQHKDAAVAAARDDQRATAANARDAVTAARDQAAAAKDQTVAAQQQAAEANDRAAAAEKAAAASAADAAAARDAAAIAAAAPPPVAPQVETTVTTSHATATHHHGHAKAVTHTTTTTGAAPATSSDQVTTTTKITP